MTAIPGVKVLQAAFGVIPATLTVIFAGFIALVALILDPERRKYALDLTDRFVDLAAVLVDIAPGQRGSASAQLSNGTSAEGTASLPVGDHVDGR